MMVDIGGDDTGLRDNLSLLRPIRVNRSRFPNGAELPIHPVVAAPAPPPASANHGMRAASVERGEAQ